MPPGAGLPLKGKDAPPITVTGFTFMGLGHYNSNEPNDVKRAKGAEGHGSASVRTVWEVHPVLMLTAAKRRPNA